MDKKSSAKPDKKLAAVCGLYCPACSVFIATHEDPERLRRIAERWNLPVEEAACDGCRSERRFVYCRTCKMCECAADKGLDFCGACAEYPCEELKKFQAEMPHRLELWESLDRIREAGMDVWFAEKAAHYACPECGTLNSAYDLACRKCRCTPGSEYARRHQDEVLAFLSKAK